MGMKVFWTDFAKHSLKSIFDYYLENAGLSVARQISRRLVDKTDVLSDFPVLGPIEPLLEDRALKVRYWAVFIYKILYWINPEKKRVEILDLFDTRQYPRKIKRSLP